MNEREKKEKHSKALRMVLEKPVAVAIGNGPSLPVQIELRSEANLLMDTSPLHFHRATQCPDLHA